MRRLLALAAVTLALAGCGNGAPGAPSPRSDGARTTAGPSAPGATSGPTPTADRSSPGAHPPTDQPIGGDPQPVDPVGPPRTLTGTVASITGCRVLDTDSGRWALLGTPVDGLRAGERVTVRGRPTMVPAGCEAVHALTVQLVNP